MKTLQNYIILSIFLFLTPYISNAQKDKCDWSTLNQASEHYQIGNLDSVVQIIETCIYEKGFAKDELKITGLHLLAKSYLELDQDSSASYITSELLDAAPYFKPDYLKDPPRFIQMVEDIKSKGNELTVTSVSKKAENIYEAPATVVSVSAKQLQQRGYNDIEAVLHDLPGFDISRSNGNLYSHIYQRGYRSINTNRTLFLVDGVEENDLWSGNVYLSRQYPLSNIKKIEVIYGPASTMYGSNAFLGVINVISKTPDDFIQPGKITGANVIGGYGSYNTRYLDGSLAMRTKSGNIALSVTGRVFFSDEQDLSYLPEHDYEPSELTDDLKASYLAGLSITDSASVAGFLATNPNSNDYYELNTDYEIIPTDYAISQAHALDNKVYEDVSFADLTETYFIDGKLKIYDILFGWSAWKKAEGPGAQYNDQMFMTADEGQMWAPAHSYFYVKYDKNINDKLDVTNYIRFKVHDFDKDNNIVRYRKNYLSGNYGLDELMTGFTPTYDSLYLFQKSNQLREELKFIYRPFTSVDIVSGFEVRFSSIQGDYTFSKQNDAEETGTPLTVVPGGNRLFSRDLGAYIQSGIELPHDLKLTLGIRYDNNLVREDEGYGSVFNPRLALVFSPKTFILKAIYAEAFKDASSREKYSTASGKRELSNPTLQPEKVKNLEFSIGNKITSHLYADAVAYYSSYSNIIQEVQVTLEDGSTTNQNQAKGKAEIYGINANANFKLRNLTAYANYTYTQPYMIDPKDSSGDLLTDSLGNPYNELRISDIADHQVNIGANWLYKEKLNLNLRTNIVGSRKTGYGTSVPTNTATFDPYAVLFGSISYTHLKTGLSIQFTVNNILDTEYYSPGLDEADGVLASKLAQNGRNMYLTIKYKL